MAAVINIAVFSSANLEHNQHTDLVLLSSKCLFVIIIK